MICGNPSFVFMYGNVFCGGCVIKADKKQNEFIINHMKEEFKNGSKDL